VEHVLVHAPRLGGTGARAALPLVGLFALALYLVGLDQGLMLSVFQGDLAYQQNYIHELVHDARHVAGFPCH
jgi:hypothetical protein